ncbi:hypothetical protein HD806DRAFT_480521 [Xylariaceae sp. AK1471]|nr:hypothetical protein HD806DRAFT_480521 [Xylariaceae sp. AK1471]
MSFTGMARSFAHGQTLADLAPQANVSGRKIRLACNRCHQQKLRCIKTKEKIGCERCIKLKMECRYSPRERRRRPIGTDSSAGSRPRGLPPAIAPARSGMPDMQRDAMVIMPEVVECDWLSFPSTEVDNAEGLGLLDSDHVFSTQTDSASNSAMLSHWPSHPTESLSRHPLDLDKGDALHFLPANQDMMSEAGSNNFLDLPSLYESYGYNNNPSRGLGSSLTSTAGRLTSLNMALYECASKLPSIKTSRTEPAGTANIPCVAGNSARRAALLAIDEVFRVTNEFIDVMKSLSPTVDCRNIPNLTTAVPVSHSSQGASAVLPSHVVPQLFVPCRELLPQTAINDGDHEPGILASAIQPFSHLDEATIFMFLSCHSRLTEIYESIFQAIQRCLEGSYVTSHSTAGIILPQLQVGGFGGISSPALRVDFDGPRLPPATVSMYLVLVTTLSSQLWAQVGEAIRRNGNTGVDSMSKQAPAARLEVTGLLWDIAITRTHNMSQTMETVQRLLQR